MGKPLTQQELHNLAMNIVGRRLEADGYEFMGVNSKPKKNPQFVCLKEKQLHFIVVRNVSFPEDPKNYDENLMAKMKEHAEKHEAKAYYAGVGLSNANDRTLPVYLNEAYIVDYEGLIEIKDDE
ncbi:Na(+)-translocating NADH-quinone reductase subunit F [Maribacter algicola]|uniref:Na(+)-translocating NADH-quinone reductase subunit F n=1 Tax=Meishania litoralis TaxID=3434685 RepID=A0ACC7LN46_9FLAO